MWWFLSALIPQTALLLAIATGSACDVLRSAFVSMHFLPSSSYNVRSRIAALQTFIAAESSVPLVSTAVCTVAVRELAKCNFVSCATDGRFVYIHCDRGLFKVHIISRCEPA